MLAAAAGRQDLISFSHCESRTSGVKTSSKTTKSAGENRFRLFFGWKTPRHLAIFRRWLYTNLTRDTHSTRRYRYDWQKTESRLRYVLPVPYPQYSIKAQCTVLSVAALFVFPEEDGPAIRTILAEFFLRISSAIVEILFVWRVSVMSINSDSFLSWISWFKLAADVTFSLFPQSLYDL